MSRYVALEGVDGSGKSTVATALAKRLEGLGRSVIVVREPGGTQVGEAVRSLLLDSESLDVWAEVYLFAAQRAELASTLVAPALGRGVDVISDRTYYSSIAYQGAARGVGTERVRSINETGLAGVFPTHVFVLDADPADALQRQVDPDRIGSEGLGFEEKVREAYLTLGEVDEKVTVLDGSLGVDEIVGRIVEMLDD